MLVRAQIARILVLLDREFSSQMTKQLNFSGDGKQRMHICHICNKTYGKTSHLRAHLRGHAGNKPFACDWQHCTKRFTRLVLKILKLGVFLLNGSHFNYFF